MRSVVWTRLPLKNYRLRRSHQKRLRKVQKKYDIRIQPYIESPEHQAVYAAYRDIARGWRPEALARFMSGEQGNPDDFKTFEASIWLDNRMLAFSLFDVGERSVQSLIGAYLPEASRDGLGFASMLIEVDWARSQGLKYHYAGYVLPGEEAMSYKLELGGMEGYDAIKDRWLPYELIPPSSHSVTRLMRALNTVAIPLASHIRMQRVVYGPFPLPERNPEMADCIGEPVFLQCGETTSPHATVVCFDSVEQVYRVMRCEQFQHELPIMDKGVETMIEVTLWRILDEIASSPSPRKTVRTVRQHLNPEPPTEPVN